MAARFCSPECFKQSWKGHKAACTVQQHLKEDMKPSKKAGKELVAILTENMAALDWLFRPISRGQGKGIIVIAFSSVNEANDASLQLALLASERTKNEIGLPMFFLPWPIPATERQDPNQLGTPLSRDKGIIQTMALESPEDTLNVAIFIKFVGSDGVISSQRSFFQLKGPGSVSRPPSKKAPASVSGSDWLRLKATAIAQAPEWAECRALIRRTQASANYPGTAPRLMWLKSFYTKHNCFELKHLKKMKPADLKRALVRNLVAYEQGKRGNASGRIVADRTKYCCFFTPLDMPALTAGLDVPQIHRLLASATRLEAKGQALEQRCFLCLSVYVRENDDVALTEVRALSWDGPAR